MALNNPQLNTLYAYLTAGCNCACHHCWFVPEKQADTNHEMLDPGLFERVVTQALPLGLEAIKWTGGEPTLNPRFEEFLAIQSRHGLDGVLETNGMLIDEKMAVLIFESGVSSVSVSLDGAESHTHDEIRGVTGAFTKTCKAIRALVSVGYRPELILTLQRSNCSTLTDFFTLAESLGAGCVKLNILQPVLRGEKLSAEGAALSIGEIIEISKMIRGEWSQSYNLPIHLDIPMAFRALSKLFSGEEDGACNIMHVLGILPSGKYALCGVGQHVPELAMGAADEVPLASIWNEHPVLKKIRAELPRKLQGVCSRCLMKSSCFGSCVASNYQLSGDLLSPFWFCQKAYEEGVFPLGRLSSPKI